MPKPWICEGRARDGLEHDNQSPKGPHEPYENFGDDCVVCNLTRQQVVGGGGASSSLPIGPIVAGAVVLILLALGGWWLLKPCPGEGQVKSFLGTCECPEGQAQNDDGDCDMVSPETDPNPEPDPNSDPIPNSGDDNAIRNYEWEPERFSWGNRTLFPGTGNDPRDRGIKKFSQGNYSEAVQLFDRAVEGNRNDPEPLIFYNNALAQQNGNPLTLAVVVPVDNNQGSAEEMLRGVAQAQHTFNSGGGRNGRLLEIVIANDGNDTEASRQVAQQLSNDSSILGVIGHNSSNASEAGLEIYEAVGLAMISPTSTSTDLDGNVFFRSTSTDAAAAKKLVSYASETLGITKVAIFYDPGSSFSTSLKASFGKEFDALGGEVREQDMTSANFNAGTQVSTSVYKDGAEAILLLPASRKTSIAIEISRANLALGDDRLPLLGGDSLYGFDNLKNGGESFEGLILAVPWVDSDPSSADFVSAGNEQWQGSVNWRTAMSYDAVQAFLSALSENASRDSVLNNLKTVTLIDQETSGRELQFTADGERQSDPLLVEVRRGENNPPGSEFGYNLINSP